MTVVSATATLELLLWLICNICIMFIVGVHTVDITFIQMWLHVTCEVVFFMLMACADMLSGTTSSKL